MELKDGRKVSAKMVVLGDGVHSKTAGKYHKTPLKHVDVGGWRYALLGPAPCFRSDTVACLCVARSAYAAEMEGAPEDAS